VAIPKQWYAVMGKPKVVAMRFDPDTKVLVVTPIGGGGGEGGGRRRGSGRRSDKK